MTRQPIIRVIIPALNEAATLPYLLAAIPEAVTEVVVVDNGSTDETATVAQAGGATVISEPRRGYGQACLTGIDAATTAKDCDILVFLDADFCDDPAMLPALVAPIIEEGADLVIGSRQKRAAPGSLTLPQRFGNRLACLLIQLFWRQRFSDLGPFRAITPGALKRLDMQDRDFGWTVEMQIKAARRGLRCAEIDVPYHVRREGISKISGTVMGVLRAGHKILYVIFREALTRHRAP